MKRNVRFDDTELTMVIDVKFPGKERWITVGYDRALEDRRLKAASEQRAHGDMLSTERNVGGSLDT